VKLYRSAVGESNVASAMITYKCIFGGEGGGGVMDPRVVTVRDSFVGMGLMLNHLASSGKTVSQLVSTIPHYEMRKEKFPCPLGAAAKVSAAVKAVFASRQGARFDEVDGLRIDLPEGWVQVRASNTEPIMRITAEARTFEEVKKLAGEVRKIADANMPK
jgi:phosphomannomutase